MNKIKNKQTRKKNSKKFKNQHFSNFDSMAFITFSSSGCVSPYFQNTTRHINFTNIFNTTINFNNKKREKKREKKKKKPKILETKI